MSLHRADERFTGNIVKQSEAGKGLCRCGRAVKRRGQRNCHLCNALASSIYRARLKNRADAAHAKLMAELANRTAEVDRLRAQVEGKDRGQESET